MKKIVLVVLFYIGISNGMFATTLLRMNLDDLTAESHAVVYGTIFSSRTEWDPDHKIISTVYTVAASQYLKGDLGPTFELRELGGERDGIAVKVSSVPVFAVGDEVVLFVWTDAQGRHQAIGFEQGALQVRADPQTGEKSVNRAISLGSASDPVSAASVPATSSRQLPQLFDQIRLSVAKPARAAK